MLVRTFVVFEYTEVNNNIDTLIMVKYKVLRTFRHFISLCKHSTHAHWFPSGGKIKTMQTPCTVGTFVPCEHPGPYDVTESNNNYCIFFSMSNGLFFIVLKIN